MKILVGVMHCIENEFEQCLRAIDRQTHPAVDRFVVSQLANKAAHDRLYGTFMERAGDVDLFVKIDADMVLSRDTFFAEVAARFSADADVHHVQIALDDWFTERRIMGLHVYRSTHRWIRNQEAYFVDMVDEGAARLGDGSALAPAGAHSPNPSPFQAFHFGVHKATKVLQRGRSEIHLPQSCTHWSHFGHLEAAYRLTREPRRGLAVAGFLHGIGHRYEPVHVDFACAETKAAFQHYQRLTPDNLDRETRRLGPWAWPSLPLALRYELAWQHNVGRQSLLDPLRVLARWRSDRLNRYRTDRPGVDPRG